MLAFFDTSIHLDILRGTRPLGDILEAVGNPPVRLSPVVASELLRGVSGRGTRSVMPSACASSKVSPSVTHPARAGTVTT
jgi:predicted nucleic acid-binding protein